MVSLTGSSTTSITHLSHANGEYPATGIMTQVTLTKLTAKRSALQGPKLCDAPTGNRNDSAACSSSPVRMTPYVKPVRFSASYSYHPCHCGDRPCPMLTLAPYSSHRTCPTAVCHGVHVTTKVRTIGLVESVLAVSGNKLPLIQSQYRTPQFLQVRAYV